MFNWIKQRKWVLLNVVLAVMLVSLIGINVDTTPTGEKVTITIGPEGVLAAGDLDYTLDGVADDVQFQAALDALPAAGGRLVVVSATTINFTATVTRAIGEVTIEGSGLGTYFANDGGTALFTAGGNNWVFKNFSCDYASGVGFGATTGGSMENILLNTTYYAYWTDDDVTADEWAIPSGRGATYIVAASNSPAHSKAQADYVCDGTADDVEIQAVIDAIGATSLHSGTVHLCAGSYYLAAPLNFRTYFINLEGEGERASRVYAANNLDDVMIENSSGSLNWQSSIRDIGFLGNSANQASGYWLDLRNLAVLLVENVNVDDIKTTGIYLSAGSGGEYATFRNVKLGNMPTGINLTGVNRAYFEDCDIGTCTTAFLYIDSCIGLTFENLHIDAGNNVSDVNFGVEIRDSSYLQFYSLVVYSAATEHIQTAVKLRGDCENIDFYSPRSNNSDTSVFIFRPEAGKTISNVYIYNLDIEGTTPPAGILVQWAGTISDCWVINSDLTPVTSASNRIGNSGTPTSTGVRTLNCKGCITEGEIRHITLDITAGLQNTVTSIQNTFGGDVIIIEVYVMISTADPDDAPTYDMGRDDDGVGAPSLGNDLFDAIPDTVGYYRSTSNGLGGGASGTQTQPIVWTSAGGANYLNFIITDDDGDGTVGTIYITVIGK